MNRIPRPIDVLHAIPGLILFLACASACAGEAPPDPAPSAAPTAAAQPAAPTPAALPAAASKLPRLFYVCTAISKDAVYDNELFEAPGDGMTTRMVQLSHGVFVAENFGYGVWHQCVWKTSLAEAQKYQQQAGANRNLPRKTTHWVYKARSTASETQPTTTTQVAAAAPPKPAPPPVATPKPSVSPPVAPKQTKPATSVAPNGNFVVCSAVHLASGQRYYNPPLQVSSGDYPEWMASYRDYVWTKYKFDRTVRCSKLPTLAEAQTQYKTITDTAKLTPLINGRPVIITNWKYP